MAVTVNVQLPGKCILTVCVETMIRTVVIGNQDSGYREINTAYFDVSQCNDYSGIKTVVTSTSRLWLL